jgi:hypothetical protein
MPYMEDDDPTDPGARAVDAGIRAAFKRLAEELNADPMGRRFAGAFDAAIQFRWVAAPIDPKNTGWFGTGEGSWMCLETRRGKVRPEDGDHRATHDWRRCVLVETDASTLLGVLDGSIRPLDAYLGDRLHVSHFTVGGVQGQWVLALLGFAQRMGHGRGLLPGRGEKRFMTFDYHGAVEARRQQLLDRTSPAARA